MIESRDGKIIIFRRALIGVANESKVHFKYLSQKIWLTLEIVVQGKLYVKKNEIGNVNAII